MLMKLKFSRNLRTLYSPINVSKDWLWKLTGNSTTEQGSPWCCNSIHVLIQAYWGRQYAQDWLMEIFIVIGTSEQNLRESDRITIFFQPEREKDTLWIIYRLIKWETFSASFFGHAKNMQTQRSAVAASSFNSEKSCLILRFLLFLSEIQHWPFIITK